MSVYQLRLHTMHYLFTYSFIYFTFQSIISSWCFNTGQKLKLYHYEKGVRDIFMRWGWLIYLILLIKTKSLHARIHLIRFCGNHILEFHIFCYPESPAWLTGVSNDCFKFWRLYMTPNPAHGAYTLISTYRKPNIEYCIRIACSRLIGNGSAVLGLKVRQAASEQLAHITSIVSDCS